MQKPKMSFEEVGRALAEQDERLRVAYAAVESGRPVPVDLTTLHTLAEVCTPTAPSCGVDGVTKWNAVRC